MVCEVQYLFVHAISCLSFSSLRACQRSWLNSSATMYSRPCKTRAWCSTMMLSNALQ